MLFPYVLKIALLVNGIWVSGDTMDGWGYRPMPSLEYCKARQADLHDWFYRAMGGKIETPYGTVTGIESFCSPRGPAEG